MSTLHQQDYLLLLYLLHCVPLLNLFWAHCLTQRFFVTFVIVFFLRTNIFIELPDDVRWSHVIDKTLYREEKKCRAQPESACINLDCTHVYRVSRAFSRGSRPASNNKRLGNTHAMLISTLGKTVSKG